MISEFNMQTRTITESIPLKLRVSSITPKPKRRYHTRKAHKETNSENGEVFNIESVVCGDGQRGPNGLCLRKSVIYASDRIDGGLESYWEVDPSSLMFSTRGGRCGGNWRTRAVTAKAKKRAPAVVPRVNIPASKRKNFHWIRTKLRDAATVWLRANEGHALSVGGPGARGGINGVEQHLLREAGPIYEKQSDGNCVSAAITNAIDAVCGREVAKALREYFYKENPNYLKIREAAILLQKLGTGAEMRKIPKRDWELFNANPFAYLATRESGVYIVHLYELKVATHALVIDVNRGLIIDSAEDYPMRLSEELLRKCGGDHAKALRVDEVRMVVKQSASNPNNHK